MRYLLDTSICVHLLHGRQDVSNKIQSVGVENCVLSEITKVELLYGALCSDRPSENTEVVNSLCRLFPVVPISGCVESFVENKYKLRKAGMMIEDFDLLIASTALSEGCILATENIKHQNRIEGLVCENWVTKRK